MSDWIAEGAAGAESWVLAEGIVGWVSRQKLGELERLEVELAALESRRRALEESIEEDVRAARSRGVAEGLAFAKGVVASLMELEETLVARATDAALELTAVLVEREISMSPELAMVAVRRAMKTLAPGHSALRIRVSSGLASVVQGLISDAVPVVEDNALRGADVVIETEQGQMESRLIDVLAAFSAEVALRIGDLDG